MQAQNFRARAGPEHSRAEPGLGPMNVSLMPSPKYVGSRFVLKMADLVKLAS